MDAKLVTVLGRESRRRKGRGGGGAGGGGEGGGREEGGLEEGDDISGRLWWRNVSILLATES